MVDIVLILLLAAIAAGVIFYLVRAKRRGAGCVGCPHAKRCAEKTDGCRCHSDDGDGGSGSGRK